MRGGRHSVLQRIFSTQHQTPVSCMSCTGRWIFYSGAIRKAQITYVFYPIKTKTKSALEKTLKIWFFFFFFDFCEDLHNSLCPEDSAYIIQRTSFFLVQMCSSLITLIYNYSFHSTFFFCTYT